MVWPCAKIKLSSPKWFRIWNQSLRSSLCRFASYQRSSLSQTLHWPAAVHWDISCQNFVSRTVPLSYPLAVGVSFSSTTDQFFVSAATNPAQLLPQRSPNVWQLLLRIKWCRRGVFCLTWDFLNLNAVLFFPITNLLLGSITIPNSTREPSTLMLFHLIREFQARWWNRCVLCTYSTSIGEYSHQYFDSRTHFISCALHSISKKVYQVRELC